MNKLTRWLSRLTTAPVHQTVTVYTSHPVPVMKGDYAHLCQCGVVVYLSPLGAGACPECHSTDLRHVYTWLRSEAEQKVRAEGRPRRGWVKALNDGVPKRLVPNFPTLTGSGGNNPWPPKDAA